MLKQWRAKMETRTAAQLREDLLCSALEGGSNYWYEIVGDNMSETDSQFMSAVPTTETGFLMIDDQEGQLDEPFRLNRSALVKGFGIFKEKYPRHYKDAVNEDDDADTGDIFLQCCIFGEAIFG